MKIYSESLSLLFPFGARVDDMLFFTPSVLPLMGRAGQSRGGLVFAEIKASVYLVNLLLPFYPLILRLQEIHPPGLSRGVE